MTDPRSLAILDELRVRTSFRASCDPPDRDTWRWFRGRMEREAINLPRVDVLRLEEVAERLTGVHR